MTFVSIIRFASIIIIGIILSGCSEHERTHTDQSLDSHNEDFTEANELVKGFMTLYKDGEPGEKHQVSEDKYVNGVLQYTILFTDQGPFSKEEYYYGASKQWPDSTAQFRLTPDGDWERTTVDVFSFGDGALTRKISITLANYTSSTIDYTYSEGRLTGSVQKLVDGESGDQIFIKYSYDSKGLLSSILQTGIDTSELQFVHSYGDNGLLLSEAMIEDGDTTQVSTYSYASGGTVSESITTIEGHLISITQYKPLVKEAAYLEYRKDLNQKWDLPTFLFSKSTEYDSSSVIRRDYQYEIYTQ